MTLKAVWIDPTRESLDMQRRILAEGGVELVYAPCESPEEVVRAAAEADALIVMLHNYVSGEVLRQLPRCRAIIRHGIGVDSIDGPTATDLGILVCNNVTYCVNEVADLAMGLLLASVRRIPQANEAMHEGRWDGGLVRPGRRLAGSTLGIIGLGRIGRRVARRAASFGLSLLACDPYIPGSVAEEQGARLVGLEELLRSSDLVTIHTPLTPETRHMIDAPQFRWMKPSAHLINTARGDIVATSALVQALEKGWIAGAALDVVEGMPPVSADHPLLRLPQAILTPHVAWYSEEAYEELLEQAARDVVSVLHGQRPGSIANPEVLRRAVCRVPELREG
jgi:D-3-phosphoglycerate dehydrogenase